MLKLHSHCKAASQKIKHSITVSSSSCPLKCVSKGNKITISKTYMDFPHELLSTWTAALFAVAQTWKQAKWPATEEWLNTLWSVHTMEYYSPLKRTEMMAHAMTWINLENIAVSEISQWQKKGQILYDSNHMRNLDWSSSWRHRLEQWLPGPSIMEEWRVIYWG